MKKVNREHIMNTTTPDERSEKEGLAREPRELSSEELESIIGGVGIEWGSRRVIVSYGGENGNGGVESKFIAADWEELLWYRRVMQRYDVF
jgi:hypothetical protein